MAFAGERWNASGSLLGDARALARCRPTMRHVLRAIRIGALTVAMAAACAFAGTIVVTTTEDELDFVPNVWCSLREAIVTVNEQRQLGVGGCSVSGTIGSSDTIWLDGKTYNLTRLGNIYTADQDRDNLNVFRSVAISGLGSDVTTIEAEGYRAYDGGILTVAAGATVVLSSLTLASGAAYEGGAIANSGKLTLEEVDIHSNSARYGGGGIRNESTGVLVVRKSLIRSNVAADGGGISNVGDAVLENSTVTGNQGNGGGGISNHGTIRVSSVTITGNLTLDLMALAPAGGLSNTGLAEDAFVENSLIAGNQNDSATGPRDCSGAFDSFDYNLIGDGTGCSGFDGINDQVGTAASPILGVLAPLADNGGPTRTHGLVADSPAIDGGPLGILDSCLSTDQRDRPRPTDGDGNGFTHCDIGAFEAAEATAPPTADVSVSMTDDPDPVAAGGALTLSLRIANAGPDIAKNVTYAITFPSGTGLPAVRGDCRSDASTHLECNVGDLASGASIVVEVQVTARTTPDTVLTTVDVGSDTIDPDETDNSDQEATLVAASESADLILSMSGPFAVLEGQNIAYVLQASNEGPETATGVVVANQIPPNTSVVSIDPACINFSGFMNCNVGNLAAGASVSFDLVVKPSRLGNVTNTAGVTSSSVDPNTSNNSDSVSTQVSEPPSADLFVALNAPGSVTAGESFVYTLIPFNNGEDASFNVVATITLDEALVFLDAPLQCSHSAGTVTCDFGTMEPFGNVSSYSIRVGSPATPGSTVTSTATIEGEVDDPYLVNNEAAAATDILSGQADVRVTKTGPGVEVVGADIVYGVDVFNAGPDLALDVELVDVLPPGVVFRGADPACVESSLTVTCGLGDLDVGTSRAVQIVVMAPGTPTVLTNRAEIRTATEDPDPANDADSVDTTIAEEVVSTDADVQIGKSAPAAAALDAEIAYSLSVFNAGPGDAENVVVEDVLPVGTAFVSATSGCAEAALVVSCDLGTLGSGASKRLTIVVRTPSTPGMITNAASVTASTNDPSPANDAAEVETDVREDVAPPVGSPLTIAVSPGVKAPRDADATAGDAGLPVLHARVANLSGVDARLTAFDVTIRSNAESAADLVAVRLHLDIDADGAVGVGDVEVASAAGAVGVLTLDADVPLASADDVHFLVTVDVDSNLATWPLAPLLSLAGFSLSFGLWHRRRLRSATWTCAGAMMLLIASCTTPSGQIAQPRDHSFELTGLQAEVDGTGAPATVTGLPVDGATLRVKP